MSGFENGFRGYFFSTGSQVHSLEGFLQPEHTPFSIGRPHTLQGVHPQV